MDERLFARLAVLLEHEPVVLASVIDTRGATPRKGGSRMLVTAAGSELSIGGGEAEARAIDAARAMLPARADDAVLDIDLTGRPGAAGVCGGTMRVSFRRWHDAADRARADEIARSLRAGTTVALGPAELGRAAGGERASPDIRLLIVGGGHCGLALYELARHLDFEIWVHDPRPERCAQGRYGNATTLCGGFEQLTRALDTAREVYAVLLNRDYPSDVAALRALAVRPPAFLGMMGSRKRIAEVLDALPAQRAALAALQAPIGLEIEAETPHEIAVSILAQLIQRRRRPR